MSNLRQSLDQIRQLISQNQRVGILLGDTSFDAVAAGTSLALSLEKAGKKVKVFASSEPVGEAVEIAGTEKISIGINQQNMIISFDYPLDHIEKVSSNQEGGRLNLVVKIKEGADPIRKNQVKIYPQEDAPEVGFIFGDETRFANIEKWLNKDRRWVWITDKPGEKEWAKETLYEPGASLSEISARIIQGLGLPMDKNIGRNLYFGIKKATNSFENIASYKTLETAALCFRMFERENSAQKGVSVFDAPPIKEVEGKEGGVFGSSDLPTPKIFKGSTTPKL